MSKLYQVPSLRVEDFPTENKWIDRLFIQLNPFFSSLSQVITQNVDFSNNIPAVTKSYSITSFSSFSFKWTFSGYDPVDVRVISATKGSSQTPTILLCAWSYSKTTASITISRIAEVLNGSVSDINGTYSFTIRATI